MSIPKFVESIRQGRFEEAQDSITDAAYNKLVGAQVQAEVQRITESAGPFAKYVAGEAQAKAAERIQQSASQGRQITPREVVTTFEHQLQSEIAQFKQAVRPGYMRSETEPGIPARQEVEDYLEMRRSNQQRLKDEGVRIATTPTK